MPLSQAEQHMANPKFIEPLRVSCSLPIDTKKAKREITERLNGRRENKEIDPSKVDVNDSKALSLYLFTK